MSILAVVAPGMTAASAAVGVDEIVAVAVAGAKPAAAVAEDPVPVGNTGAVVAPKRRDGAAD